jgi:hypothetical protein
MNNVECSQIVLVPVVYHAVQLLEEGGVWQVIRDCLGVEVDEDIVFMHHTLHDVDEICYGLGEGGKE